MSLSMLRDLNRITDLGIDFGPSKCDADSNLKTGFTIKEGVSKYIEDKGVNRSVSNFATDMGMGVLTIHNLYDRKHFDQLNVLIEEWRIAKAIEKSE